MAAQQIGANHWRVGDYCLTFGWREFGAKPSTDRGGCWFIECGGRLVHVTDLFTEAKEWAEAQTRRAQADGAVNLQVTGTSP